MARIAELAKMGYLGPASQRHETMIFTPETILFYVFAILAIVSSIAVIAFRNPLYSAIALIVDFFFFAGLYALLSAHFMAVAQILVYGGAIMVLFLFIIMLLNLQESELPKDKFRFHHVLAVLGVVGLLFFSLSAVMPLSDNAQIAANRAAAAEQQALFNADVEGFERPKKAPVYTASKIPGLASDLNETALEAQYAAQVAAIVAGEPPFAGKFRPYKNSPPQLVPPVMKGEAPRGGKLHEPMTFGTAEPISLLLVNRFVVPFELTAILLLAAIVGAVIIAKKRL